MIQVDRGPEPDDFATYAAGWWSEFEEKQQKSECSPSKFWSLVRKRKAMKSYVEILSKTFHDKCAFCESKMKHVSPGHIEHYRPKDKFPDQMFVWENWLFSCGTCNTNKGTKFPYCDDGQPCFLDPTAEDPSEHIDFLRSQTNAPYTAMTRAYLYRKMPKLANPDTPHPFIELSDPLVERIEKLVEKYNNQLQQVR